MFFEEGLATTYVLWALTAGLVSLLSFLVIRPKIKNKEFDDVFWFALAIFVSWFFAGLHRVWFGIRRWLELNGTDSMWMINHWAPFILSIIVTAGGILHVRTLSKRRYGEKGWTMWLVFLSVVAFFLMF